MKKNILIIVLILLGNTTFAASSQFSNVRINDVHTISTDHRRIDKLTSKIKSRFKKVFKKVANTNEFRFSKEFYLLAAFIGLGWFIIGIYNGFKGPDWYICLFLYFFGFIPGIIYTLVKMKIYY